VCHTVSDNINFIRLGTVGHTVSDFGNNIRVGNVRHTFSDIVMMSSLELWSHSF
jgi:hypothetical protein